MAKGTCGKTTTAGFFWKTHQVFIADPSFAGMKSDSSLGKNNVSITYDKNKTKQYDSVRALFDMEKLCFALVLKMDFSIVGKEKKMI